MQPSTHSVISRLHCSTQCGCVSSICWRIKHGGAQMRHVCVWQSSWHRARALLVHTRWLNFHFHACYQSTCMREKYATTPRLRRSTLPAAAAATAAAPCDSWGEQRASRSRFKRRGPGPGLACLEAGLELEHELVQQVVQQVQEAARVDVALGREHVLHAEPTRDKTRARHKDRLSALARGEARLLPLSSCGRLRV